MSMPDAFTRVCKREALQIGLKAVWKKQIGKVHENVSGIKEIISQEPFFVGMDDKSLDEVAKTVLLYWHVYLDNKYNPQELGLLEMIPEESELREKF